MSQIVAVPDADDVALLDEAHRLAEAIGDAGPASEPPTVVAVTFDGLVTPDEAAAGAPDEVLHVTSEEGTFTSGAAGIRPRSQALAELTDDARAVLLPDTADGVDLAAATARRRRGACVTDCLLRVRDGKLRAGRPAYGGRAYAEFDFEREPPVVTLNTESLGTPDQQPEGEPTQRTVEVDVDDDDRIRHVETFEVPEDDLSKARRIVAGGFGLGSPDGFDLIEDLADAFGAAIGASRPPSDEGWVPYDRQIGVTGKEIDVEVYVPCAISGDSYHMRSVNADHLIPINSDPEARVFNFADIGIVGDVYEYGPALAEAVRRARTDNESAAAEEVVE
ncbi:MULTISPECIES: electron transfer flavoprotein subunit alpha/FixB family protein [Halolamina]|uniref:Electron transfer flavoprotein alpha subunit n=1 Tax=Halolamina pelagica TaxID=699431 RepID=A0A1I5T5U8_9EURY|nr:MULTISPECIES: electron transfer flavoprotein subunit alpha/FixB family protein [Halolamina]NHX37484.1 electron transfer flavoprotein subunit alpha/FixB family protein [Halolamina sp. R1-12]SFP78191.1 electron transfer flavoprotein alpha subunit [Halolamina pelagica]